MASASRTLLQEKQVVSLQKVPSSWKLHLLSGGWKEVAVSPEHNYVLYRHHIHTVTILVMKSSNPALSLLFNS